MVTEQTIDTKRIMKQFYLSILCLAFIAGGGNFHSSSGIR